VNDLVKRVRESETVSQQVRPSWRESNMIFESQSELIMSFSAAARPGRLGDSSLPKQRGKPNLKIQRKGGRCLGVIDVCVVELTCVLSN